MKQYDEYEFEQGQSTRFQRFQDLMPYRVREILLVSSLYDSFILSEDGSFYESLLSEYLGLGLTHMPQITRVSQGSEAVKLATQPNRFDIVITSLRAGDMHARELAARIKRVGADTPVILLTYDNRELNDLVESGGVNDFDKVFIWQGDFRIFLAIIKFVEDRNNVKPDTDLVGVQTIILIEDNVKFYSSYLPLIYTAVLEHTTDLIAEGVNPAHKLLRMRARPKILLCSTYEEAWEYFREYHETVLGVISDIEFPRGGVLDKQAGFEFARQVKKWHADISVLLQSRDVSAKSKAEAIGAQFLQKGSAVLLHELRRFMIHHFGFGDFIFRLRDGTVVGRASDLRSLEDQIYVVPDESLEYHGERNDFSVWLKARTDFLLAHRLRPVRLTDFESTAGLREHLIGRLREHRREQHRGSIIDFDADTFDEHRSFARVGSGSLGGKARGLGFANSLINAYGLENRFEGVRISVPPSVILGADVYDQFLEENGLFDFATRCEDDEEITERFLEAQFPEMYTDVLNSFLYTFRDPLSVRSSGLLEDSQFMPFAGIYETLMIPNNHHDQQVRLRDLIESIKRVYASTFFQPVKRYIKSTPYRLEEEKMAVVVQKLVGSTHENRYYPGFSGVARSYNFYPIPPMTTSDGIASVALGLGKTVVEGGATVRFCPRYPKHIVHFSSVDEILKYSQNAFFALELPDPDAPVETGREMELVSYGLDVAERDGVLSLLGSTYSLENHTIYDGVSRKGPRVVTFAPVLKYDVFPLPAILQEILALCTKGMNGPVEIEFAVNTVTPKDQPAEFYLLQMRPMVIEQEMERLRILDAHQEDLICRSDLVLGNGAVFNIRDVVVVDHDTFDRRKSEQVAGEIRVFNHELVDLKRPYLLIGVGRWGSADPWLGIPVRWEDINGAQVIVEAGLKDIKVAPSQGTHFFQNITSSRVGYITVPDSDGSFIDWEWLASQEATETAEFTRRLRFDQPISVVMDGHRR
ncbi:MAG: PEP/pyruvate-binding domain-containing protein, partial [Candidatus Latescibacterota bacterium]